MRVLACGVCGTDLLLSSGALEGLVLVPSFPWTLGHEVGGFVEELGDRARPSEGFEEGPGFLSLAHGAK
ncbi:alcohol dehydrogenase catalytic domain-containing protein [Streptomyces sp. NPDC097610]|uniref:alcohol dehydrogenase catalytic domain-containing protein n=1 Tax=Streptomyces sp. NPDC097610 TaxID=3157227 RepID=UPI0033183EFF